MTIILFFGTLIKALDLYDDIEVLQVREYFKSADFSSHVLDDDIPAC